MTYDPLVIDAVRSDPVKFLKSRDEVFQELEFWRERCLAFQRVAVEMAKLVDNAERVR